MKLFGIIGYQLDHSLSPFLMNRFFRYAHIDAAYGCFPVESHRLQDVVAAMHELRFVGANVTIPYKETVLPMVDLLSDEASKIGAVNTFFWKDGSLEGHNSDAVGFLSALKEVKFSPGNKKALVFGAGGAARAVAYALLSNGCEEIFVAARNQSKGLSMCEAFKNFYHGQVLNLLPWASEEIARVTDSVDLIVNATPIGMGALKGKLPPIPSEFISSKHFVFDLIYDPQETSFLMTAKRKGAKTLNGFPMLLYQAAQNLEIWLGESVQAEAVPYWRSLLKKERILIE